MKKINYLFGTSLVTLLVVIISLIAPINVSAVPALSSKLSFNDNIYNNSNKNVLYVNNNSNFEKGDNSTKNYVEGEVLVKFKQTKIDLKTTSGIEEASKFAKNVSTEKTEDLKTANISVLKITDGKSVEAKIAELEADPNVEYAQPNYKKTYFTISSNDTYKNNLWGLDNTGQSINLDNGTEDGYNVSGIADSDVDAPEAWAINEGTNAEVIVAVIDSGVAYNHPDLANQMWDGTNCKDYNGSPLGGCEHGYNFENSSYTINPLPSDSSHGTHVSGIIAAEKNNNHGIIGIAPNAKIMALKFALDEETEIKAIDFAIQNGAKVINASFGGYHPFSQAEYDAIRRFGDSGGIFVAAAGNESNNNDGQYIAYPASYNLDNIISVAATDSSDNLTYFSNYGKTSVDVGAPGLYIQSTIADIEFLNEDFESITAPALPNGWTKSGTNNKWGTERLIRDGYEPNNVLFGQRYGNPYDNNTDSYVTSSAYDWTAPIDGAVPISGIVKFITSCDTQYDLEKWTDYMEFQESGDGINWRTSMKWDEALINEIHGDTDDQGSATIGFMQLIYEESSNWHYRFHWVTDSSDNNYRGCFVDNLQITAYGDGLNEPYAYYSGTSMAAPMVTGLVALIEGYKPNLSASRVKSIILSSGDYKTSLNNTVSSRRINARNALMFASADAFIYQSHVGTDGKIYTRFSIDGINWTSWSREMNNAPGESTKIPITMTSMGKNIYQSHVGTDGKVYTRSSNDGNSWSTWSREMTNAPGEATRIPITMTSANNTLFQSHVGTDRKIYSRNSVNGINWSSWTRELQNSPGEATDIPITMTSIDDTIYQSHVGTDGKVYTRSSTDGINWTTWSRELTNAPGEATRIPITMTSMGTNVYQSHVGTDGKVYTRSSTDGISWTTWSREMTNAPGESTKIPITMASMGTNVYQSHVGTDGKIYTRSSTDGISWTTWSREMTNAPGESTAIPITMTSLIFID